MEFTVTPRSLVQEPQRAVLSRRIENTLFLDFGKAVYGTLEIQLPSDHKRTSVVVHLGESIDAGGRLNRTPDGCIRYLRIEQTIPDAAQSIRLQIPADERNTGPGAVPMPAAVGEVYPFRYVEIEAASDIEEEMVKQIFVHYPFDDSAALFISSDETLNQVWDLCKHTIKATTFCGVYVDGDRERIPYEGDAYINQLCHYGVDHEYDFARYSLEYLLQRPTWPTEWQLHTVMMAWADYQYSGVTTTLDAFYDLLKCKSLIELARADGLISLESPANTEAFRKRLNLHNEHYIFDLGLRDLVDWPPGSFTEGGIGERDNHEMLPVNTVVNAFHYQSLRLLAEIARTQGCNSDVARFTERADLVYKTFNEILFDTEQGLYIDGEGSNHASQHSNMFAVAFDLVPEERQEHIRSFLINKGMACSVYGAQYLLEALYALGADNAALNLMRAHDDRSWWNMIAAGSTMTLEAWDIKYKNNLDWNHAWGAAPGNIIPRYLMGIRPLEPGCKRVLIKPQPGDLERASIRHPSPSGPITVCIERGISVEIQIPTGMSAEIDLSNCFDGSSQCESLTVTHNTATCTAGRYVFTAI